MANAIVRQAQWPQDGAIAQELLLHYADFLQNNLAGPVTICLGGYQRELSNLRETYPGDAAVLLLGYVGTEPAGCVAVKRRPDRPGACEIKRLWTEPVARGHGLGSLLMQAAIDWAARQGAEVVLLDTVAKAMPQAVVLYRALGFEETDRHNDNPVDDLTFFALRLR